jgi:hypothetical protein
MGGCLPAVARLKRPSDDDDVRHATDAVVVGSVSELMDDIGAELDNVSVEEPRVLGVQR